MTAPAMFSTPALVLTLGTSMLPAMVEIERIHLQSDARRGATTRFLAANVHPQKNEAEWVSLNEAPRNKRNPCSWKDAHEQARNLIEPLKDGIRSALHELRSHEKLIEVGLGGKTTLPLDVYLIADLSEADASALLVIMPAIQSLLADEPYAAFHILLSVAIFEEVPVSHANLHFSLNNLRVLLESQNEFRLPHIYLFDRFKEGLWEARDNLEVQTILGNFLLALLSGGLAQRIAHQLPQSDMAQHQAYFCGASAAAIFLDMEQLQKACVLRLGREIIENEFHSKVDPNPGAVEELAGNFLAEYANPKQWKRRLCKDSLYHANAAGEGLAVHIFDLRFEDMPIEEWVKAIQHYDDIFSAIRLPAQRELVNKNSVALNQEFHEALTAFAQSLPAQARLYPGGVRGARLVLEKIRRVLLESFPAPSDESRVEQEWTAPIKTSLEWLDNAIRKLPKPPRWVLRLPHFVKNPMIQLFNLVYLPKDLKTIADLREACLSLLEKKYAALVDARIDHTLAELIKTWVTAVEKQIRSIKRLQSTLDKLPDRFRPNEMITASSSFRISAINETLAAWAYYNGKRPPSGFRYALLTERNFLSDWQRKNREDLEERLMEFCRGVFDNISDMDLEEALSHRNGKDASDLAMALSQGAIPLLRPNFDQAGGGPSYPMRFYLSKDPHGSSVFPHIKSDTQDWQEISTGDPYLAICCRARMALPLASINHIFERGRIAYDALERETKKQYFLMEGK